MLAHFGLRRRPFRAAAALAIAALVGAQTVRADQIGVWTPLGPRAATVFALERDPLNPAVLYAGMYFGGLYKTTDNGMNWFPLPSDFSMATVFAVAIDPTTSGIVFAGTFDQGIFRSADGGQTWSAVAGASVGAVQAIAIDPHNHSTVLATTYSAVLVSSDGGLTWTASTSPQGSSTLLFDPATPGRVYLGTGGNGVFISDDSGLTWTPFTTGMGSAIITRLELDAGSPGIVLASATEGIFRSRADGTGWDDITGDLTARFINQTVRRASSGTLFAATDVGVYRLDPATPGHWVQWTTEGARFAIVDPSGAPIHIAGTTSSLNVTYDDGAHFYPSDFGIQNRFVESLVTVNASGQTVIYAGTDHGVALTSELFRNSRELPWLIETDTRGEIFDVAPRPSSPGVLFTGTEGAGVWKSSDYGNTWTPSTNGIVPAAVLTMDQSPVDHTLYAGTSFGVYSSHDNGLTWSPNTDTTPKQVSAVLADPVRPSVAYYGTSQGEVLRSLNGGISFNPAWPGVGIGIQKLATAMWGNIYAVNTAGQLYVSTDMGDHFFQRAADEIPEQILTAAVDPSTPWVAYVGTVFGGVYKTTTDAIHWTKMISGMDVPLVYSLAIDPAAPSTIYAGSQSVIFKSTDGAATWQKLTSGLPDGAIIDLRVDPLSSQTVYASINNAGVYKSTDGGASWALLRSGTPFVGSLPIVPSQTTAGVVFAGTLGGGVYRSTDGGTTWAPSNNGLTVFIRDIAVDPANPDTMYAATLVDGVFKSTDGGATWARKGLAGIYVYNLVIDPTATATIYASTPTGVVRSTDGGDTWVELGQKIAYAFSIASDPADRNLVYAGGIGGALYRSSDGGLTWASASAGLPGLNVLGLAVDPTTRNVYASLDGIYVSRDRGVSWQRTGAAPSFANSQPGSLAIDAVDASIYVGTFGAGLNKSIDGGVTWQRLALPAGTDYVAAVRLSPADPNVVFASTLSVTGTGPGLFVSTDGGATWSASATGLTGSTVFSIAFDPASPDTMYAATDTGVSKSVDRGASWAPAGSGLATAAVRQVFVAPSTGSSTVYVGTAAQGIFRSPDGGTTWQAVTAPFGALSVSDFALGSGTGLVYAATLGNGVVYGTAADADLHGGTDATQAQVVVHQLVIDPGTPTTLYAATGGQGVLKSTDGGITWQHASAGITYPFLLAIAIDPVLPNTLYAGTTGGGVFVSDDGAATWTAMNVGLFHRRVTSLAIDANNHNVIYAGTEGGGVFRLTR